MTERLRLRINGSLREVEIRSRERNRLNFSIDGRGYEVSFDEEVPAPSVAPAGSKGASKPQARQSAGSAEATHTSDSNKSGAHTIRAPIPGVVIALLVTEGEWVQAGQTILRLEAMKMENNIFAPVDGVIERLFVQAGEELMDAQPIVEIRASKK
jgi:biotin carboxyl carrier protein